MKINVIVLKHEFDGPYGSGTWEAHSTGKGEELRIEGREASMLSLLLAGRKLRENLHPLDAIERGQDQP